MEKKLVFSNWVWRHGDRSAVTTFPNNPYKNQDLWKNGPGQLTNIGMRQQYELGQYLREKYDGLLSKEYLHKEIYARSTDMDRTIMSAQANMDGLYPVTDDEKWNGPGTTWHPIPVHVVPLDQDLLLKFPHQGKGYQRYADIINEIKASPWYKKEEKKLSPFLKMVSKNAGKEYTFSSIWEIHDCLFCLQAHGHRLPSWASDSVMEKLDYLHSLTLGLMFTDVQYKYRKEISPMQGGFLLKSILHNMKNQMSGSSERSAIAYSAHDTTLTALLVTLGCYDWVRPSYASCVMIDLYRTDDGQFFVELYYRKRDGTVTQLQFEDCSKSCRFEEFESKCQDLIPGDKICSKFPKSTLESVDKINSPSSFSCQF